LSEQAEKDETRGDVKKQLARPALRAIVARHDGLFAQQAARRSLSQSSTNVCQPLFLRPPIAGDR